MSLEENQTGLWWAICSLDIGSFYGAVGLNNLKREHNKAEIDFWLLPPFWKLGIMAESVPLVCQYGFDALGLHRIEGFVEMANEASKKVFIKAGFNHEGRLSDCELKETQEVIDYCEANKIYPQVQIITAEEINEAWQQVVSKKARYQFVIDAATI